MNEFNIIKRNRKYFKATKDNYPCRIVIDQNSENLELGLQTLQVIDMSIKSKFGVDLIYKLDGDYDTQKEVGIITLETPSYNRLLVDECRTLGGKWDSSNKVWVFSSIIEDKIEILDEKYNSEMTPIELKFITPDYGDREPIFIVGFMIAKASGRDSGAQLADGVALISGNIRSGGSMKNWTTYAAEDSVIRMHIPFNCLSDIDKDHYKVTILSI